MTEPGEPEDTTAEDPTYVHPRPVRRGLWVVVGVLATTSLLLASRDQLPGAPVLIVVMVGLGFGLWWLADRGGRRNDRPVAGPVEALGLVAAVLAAIAVFWVVFGWLD